MLDAQEKYVLAVRAMVEANHVYLQRLEEWKSCERVDEASGEGVAQPAGHTTKNSAKKKRYTMLAPQISPDRQPRKVFRGNKSVEKKEAFSKEQKSGSLEKSKDECCNCGGENCDKKKEKAYGDW
ncbi:hypothetical protein CJU89_5908 [Yarrowia sp. B02]|nr:hypothetical protein CJU89_5908 [Yarrowia sp. B02]